MKGDSNEPTAELMVEILRDLQQRLGRLEDGQRELKENALAVRKDVHMLRGDVLRQETWQAEIEVRLDRIDTTLGISSETPDA